MSAVVRWPADDRLVFLGRNGIGKCTGLDIFEFEGVVELRPITSKNQIGRAQLRVPVAALPELVKVLNAIRRSAPATSTNRESENRHGNLCRNNGQQRFGLEGR